jgi:hypothetical protein
VVNLPVRFFDPVWNKGSKLLNPARDFQGCFVMLVRWDLTQRTSLSSN